MRPSPRKILAATLTLFQLGGEIMATICWCPHEVLKATGAPAYGLFLILTEENASFSSLQLEKQKQFFPQKNCQAKAVGTSDKIDCSEKLTLTKTQEKMYCFAIK